MLFRSRGRGNLSPEKDGRAALAMTGCCVIARPRRGRGKLSPEKDRRAALAMTGCCVIARPRRGRGKLSPQKDRRAALARTELRSPRRFAPRDDATGLKLKDCMKHIGMIGIGLMGLGIASNLVKHGHPLRVLEHAGNQPLDGLKAQGVSTARTPRELASQVEVLILCVTGSPQVEAVLNGPDGALQGLRPGTVVIDCSTAVPASTERMAAMVQAAGGRFIDSPMTRTPKEAAEGRLNLLVGGDKALFDECRPLLADRKSTRLNSSH